MAQETGAGLKIEIHVSEDGDFRYTYTPKSKRVKIGESVAFYCAAPGLDKFAVHIGWDSPLNKGRFRSSESVIEANVPKNARPGVYEFFVAALIDSPRPDAEGEKAIYTDDPDFIVEN